MELSDRRFGAILPLRGSRWRRVYRLGRKPPVCDQSRWFQALVLYHRELGAVLSYAGAGWDDLLWGRGLETLRHSRRQRPPVRVRGPAFAPIFDIEARVLLVIVQQPQSQMLTLHSNATFQVVARGAEDRSPINGGSKGPTLPLPIVRG